MLFVVIEDPPDRLDTGVILAFVVLPGCLLVPVEDLVVCRAVRLRKTWKRHQWRTNSANEWGDQCHASFSTGNGLSEAKEKSEIAVYALVALELSRGLDTFPGRCDLDEHTFSLDANRLVQ